MKCLRKASWFQRPKISIASLLYNFIITISALLYLSVSMVVSSPLSFGKDQLPFIFIPQQSFSL
jgi:hypothetical protein